MQLLQTYARNKSNRFTADSTAEEDNYQDILLIIQLLSNLLYTVNPSKSPTKDNYMYVYAFLFGLEMFMPMITSLLQFPPLCLQ